MQICEVVMLAVGEGDAVIYRESGTGKRQTIKKNFQDNVLDS